MTRCPDTIVLAADGGGTRCRLAADDGANRWQVEVGATNVSTSFDGAVAELLLGLKALEQASGISRARLIRAPVYLGLAGITGPELAGQLVAALPFEHVRIEDDRAASLRGALGPDDGIVGHCGTGSFLAARISGSARFAGGWGPILGDQASAQWVGRRALSAALDFVDGVTTPASDLAEQLLSRFGGAAGIVDAAANLTATEFGALAPIVTSEAGVGDALAMAIMDEGAAYLADHALKMGWQPGVPVCLTGGIGPHYADYLPQQMRAALQPPKGDPLTGAIALAHAFREEIEDEHY